MTCRLRRVLARQATSIVSSGCSSLSWSRTLQERARSSCLDRTGPSSLTASDLSRSPAFPASLSARDSLRFLGPQGPLTVHTFVSRPCPPARAKNLNQSQLTVNHYRTILDQAYYILWKREHHPTSGVRTFSHHQSFYREWIRQGRIDSVKINPSLEMMIKCEILGSDKMCLRQS